MDLMRQQLAPISDAAWDEINDEAKNVFALGLSGRRLADVSGPLGIGTAAVNLGRLEIPKKQGKDKQGKGLRYGVRRVLPLVEVRAPFELDIWELDNVDRGARDPDLDDLRRAAREVAKFEERAIYDGFPDASIEGLLAASEFEPIEVATEPGSLLDGVAKAAMRLRYADVEGPYALALGAALYQWLDSGSERGYPLRKRLLQTIEGPIIPAPYLHGGVVMSRRGGDAELTLGQDIAIGYESHDQRTVRLYFSESFTFRVLAPEAIVALKTEASR